jgi:3'-phosphoadenosine 5'-phosphosulfate sulfotransferase (PAPS reductase)/FAD synthetase
MKHVLGFSGGADSQAVSLWLRQRYSKEDVVLTFCDAGGNEHPMTYEFIRWYSDNIHPVHFITPIVADMAGRAKGKIEKLGLGPNDPLTFDLLAKLKGRFPATKSRFCTSHLKLYPMLRWTRENIGSLKAPDDPEGGPYTGFERYAGVRRDESAARAMVDLREFDDLFMCWLNRPIADWTKAQVFDFLTKHGEPYNPLYKLGFGRVGCAPCINSNKEGIRLWVARFPEMIEKVRRWEKEVGRTFFPPMVPGMRINWIDDVVEWSRTTRGGKQYGLSLFEADVESGMCMSKYGLCE